MRWGSVGERRKASGGLQCFTPVGGARWLKRWGWFGRQIVPQVEAGWWGREGG